MTAHAPTTLTDDVADVSPSKGYRVLAAVCIGMSTAIAALGSAEMVAGLYRKFASPVTSVGSRVIDAAPPWLKTFAIENFGTNDKPILVGSVYVLLTVFAIVLGVLARKHLTIATFGAALFGVLGAIAAFAGVGGVIATIPSIIGGVVAVVVLRFLAQRAWGRAQGEPAPATPAANPDRRSFLIASGAIAAGGALLGVSGRWLRTRFDAAVDRSKVVLPKAKAPLAPLDTVKFGSGVPGGTPFITSNADFYRIDTALDVPQVSLADWKLTIKGMVDKELSFTFDELLERTLVEADITLTCVSNEVGGQLAGTARWLGIPLSQLLEEAGVQANADQVVGRSVDAYTCGFPLSAVNDGRTAMVVVGMNGEPLPVNHGFPARLLVAGLYGYVSATKWLSEIEVTRFDQFDQYWVPRGWDNQAPIKTLSRIDTPAGLSKVAAGTHPIAGVAWAQTRGISAVEVQVDDGPWTPAELRDVPNNETWRQWVLPWEFAPGSHTVTCRATDGTGEVQTTDRVEPRPNGASGWHSVVVLVS